MSEGIRRVARAVALCSACAGIFSAAWPGLALARPGEAPAWTRLALVAHATGSLPGATLTNSREAVEANYAKGYRIFEVDFLYTRDGRLVARHDWSSLRFRRFGQPVPPGGVPSFAEFRRAHILHRYHPLTLPDVVSLLEEHPDAYVMTDVKELGVGARVRGLSQLSQVIGDRAAVRRRIIVQIYEEADLKPARQLGFSQFAYTFYHLKTSVDRGIAFSAQHRIAVVTVPSFMVDATLARKLKNRGIVLATHTINNPRVASRLRRLGVKLIYSDKLTPTNRVSVTRPKIAPQFPVR